MRIIELVFFFVVVVFLVLYCVLPCVRTSKQGFNLVKYSFPVSPNSDQHQISPCNSNAYSTPEVMRIKDVVTQGEFS